MGGKNELTMSIITEVDEGQESSKESRVDYINRTRLMGVRGKVEYGVFFALALVL